MMPEEIKTKKKINLPLRRIRFGLIVVVSGFLIFLIGVKPEIFLLDRSPVLGFVQISVMLVGLAIMCIGGYISINGLWKGRKRSIAAELAATLIPNTSPISGYGRHAASRSRKASSPSAS
jgi:hypothetical protein